MNKIFTKEVISHLQQNKHEITSELLEKLRKNGNEGKQIALDILDIDKDSEQYYLDAYDNRISVKGNRRLKKPFTKLNLADIHIEELKKCKDDIHYYKENYVKIITPKGLNFPDLRSYQDDFIDLILPDENEEIVGLLPRQSGKTVNVGIYLSWVFNFGETMNIGIAANKGKQAAEFLDKTKKIFIELPLWMQTGIEVWNKTFIENETGMRIITDGTNSDSFRGFTCALVIVDECAFIKSSLWEEFSDSIFPAQSGLAWKKNILISTANGLNHFHGIIKGAREDTNGYIPFEVSWKDVPRYKPDGSLMSNDEFQNKIVNSKGVVHFNQNYANQFIGSSYTLISSDTLKSMNSKEVQYIRDGKLKIYEEVEENHKYIMSVDPAKDGIDAFSVQIVDITDFKFKQVASAKLQIDYLLMPEFLDEWGKEYNNAYLIIENNEGAGQSIADQMYQTYEYDNLHFDKDVGRNKKKKYAGFRTTVKTRKQILQTLKLFIENGNLEVNDQSTISEFYRFILIKNKFQADDDAHDDMIMSLALAFVPFCNTKNFEDMKKLVKNLYDDDIPEAEKADFGELLTIGSFDSMDDENYQEHEEYLSIEDAMSDMEGFI